MMRFVHLALIALLVGFCVWLFRNERTAEPNRLILAHEESAACTDCHVPWKGVSDAKCLDCHSFDDVSLLHPEIRFHQAGVYCLACHTEHKGPAGPISVMDHTLLNPDLLCSQCHLDPHRGLFGTACRECHGIRTWKIPGYRHPPAENRNCDRCHALPGSHRGSHYRNLILQAHRSAGPEAEPVPATQCWRCHVTHDWRHRLMGTTPPAP